MQIDWMVLSRQIALIVIPAAVVKGIVPEYLAGPMTDLLAYVLGTVVVAGVVAIGQRLAQPEQKIAAVANLDAVEEVRVSSPKLADSIPSEKVVS